MASQATSTTHRIGTRDEWLAERLELLEAEKDLTRRSDALAQRRQALPWVRVDKAYRFDTEDGSASLPDLFRGRSQLLIYHFMFGPDYKAGCPSCSSIADGFDGIAVPTSTGASPKSSSKRAASSTTTAARPGGRRACRPGRRMAQGRSRRSRP
jgi:predicted dithiol-disulfide oxidoreductase (DUF899 family)